MRQRIRAKAAMHLIFVVFVSSSLSAGIDQEPAPPKTSIRFAYVAGAFSEVAMRDVKVALEIWSNDLQDRLGKTDAEVTVEILESQAEIDAAVESERVDVIILGPLDFFKMKRRELVEPAMLPTTAGKVTQKYKLLAKQDRFTRIQDLEGKHLLMHTGGQGDLPLIWLETLLGEGSQPDCDRFFGVVENTDKVSHAVLAVFFDKADACIITDRGFSTMNELNPQIGARLVTLRESPELVRGLICFRKKWEEEAKKSTLDIMLNLHKEPKGAQILMIFQEERLIPYDPRYFEQTRRLEQNFLALNKNPLEKAQK